VRDLESNPLMCVFLTELSVDRTVVVIHKNSLIR
jgi:hypothetical protein